MLESLVCPNCSAPLTISADGGESMQCPYCHTTVLLRGQSSRASSPGGRALNQTAGPTVRKSNVVLKATAVIVLLIGGLTAVIFGIVDHSNPTGSALPGAIKKPPLATMTLEFGSKGITPGHFESASCISLDRQGHIYVGERDSGRVQVFDTTGKYLSEFSVGSFDDLVADRDGTLYVVSGGKICRFNGVSGAKLPDMERAVEDYIGRQTPVYYRCVCLAPGAIYAITGYAVDTPSIVKLNTATGRIVSTVNATIPPGDTPSLNRILALTTGEIYGLDTQFGAVFKFSTSGAYINKFGGKSGEASSDDAPPSQIQWPSSLASDSQGRIYVGDSSGIKVYDKDGNYIDGIGDGDFPRGITIDDQDNIYACFDNFVREYVLQKY